MLCGNEAHFACGRLFETFSLAANVLVTKRRNSWACRGNPNTCSQCGIGRHSLVNARMHRLLKGLKDTEQSESCYKETQ